VNADSEFQLVIFPMTDFEVLDRGQELQRQRGDLTRVRVRSLRQAGDHHVGVADGFHLVHVEALDDLVESRVQFVEEINDLN